MINTILHVINRIFISKITVAQFTNKFKSFKINIIFFNVKSLNLVELNIARADHIINALVNNVQGCAIKLLFM